MAAMRAPLGDEAMVSSGFCHTSPAPMSAQMLKMAQVQVQELLGGAFLRLDTGDPDGALACALQALELGAGGTVAAVARDAARRDQARQGVQLCEEILRR